MFTAIFTIAGFMAGLAVGRWLYPSEASVRRRQDMALREQEWPEHDYEKARQIAEAQTEFWKAKGWTSAG